jgi:hypothetical protein
MKVFRRYFLLVISMLFFIYACSAKPNELILGKWQDSSGTSMEFFKDGTGMLTDSGPPVMGMKMKMNFKYIILDDKRLKMDINGPFGSATTIYKVNNITKNDMDLTDENGKRGVCKKVNN